MISYLICYIFLVTGSLFEIVYKKKNLSIICFFAAFLILLSSLRGDEGIDTKNYIEFFEDIGTNKLDSHEIEIGFKAFSVILKNFTESPELYFFVIALFSIGFKAFAIWKISPLPGYSMLVLFGTYFLSLETNQIRQGLALAFVLVALYYDLNEKRRFSFVFAILAGSFHVSALIFVLAWFFKKRIPSFALIISVLFSFSFVFISIETLIVKLLTFSFIWNEFALTKLLNYASKIEKVGFSLIQVWYIALTFVFVYYRRFVKNRYYNYLLNLFVFGVVLNFCLNSFSYLLRLSYYFLVVEGILIGILIYNSRYLSNRIALWLVVSVLLFLRNYGYYIENNEVYG